MKRPHDSTEAGAPISAASSRGGPAAFAMGLAQATLPNAGSGYNATGGNVGGGGSAGSAGAGTTGGAGFTMPVEAIQPDPSLVDPHLLALSEEELEAYIKEREESDRLLQEERDKIARIQDLNLPAVVQSKQIEYVHMLLIKGWQPWQITQEIRTLFGLCDDTIRRRIEAARALQVAQINAMTRTDKAAELVQLLQDVGRIAREQGRGSDVIGASRLQCELLGLLNRDH